MGLPMAHNLLRSHYTVTVFNRTAGRAKSLVSKGAREAATVLEAVKEAEIAITMLSDDAAVREVVLGSSGLLQGLPPKAIHICMTSIEVETSAELAAAHTQAGQGYVAAPVFGRAETADSRHIWIVAGGSEPQVNRCRPIFETLARGYTRVGPSAPLAHALKLSGNLLTIAMELAASEILTYAKKVGLPPADFLRFLNTAIFRSHMVGDYGGLIDRPSYDPEDKTLDLAANELLFQATKNLGVDIPVVDLLTARLQAAESRGWGEQDLAGLSEACRVETGIEGTLHTPLEAPMETPLPIPPVLRQFRRSMQEPRKDHDIPETAPAEELNSQPITPLAKEEQLAGPKPGMTEASTHPPAPMETSQLYMFSALDDGRPVTLDLNQTSHFELIKGRVWAWLHGKCYETSWNKLGQVELAFNQTLFLTNRRDILMRPEAVLDFHPKFGGGAKVRVDGGLELDISRSAAPRLKELLGI